MEVENKLDEDFLFYLGFTSSFSEQFDNESKELCRAWLRKLCGEPCIGMDQKRNRNVYLSNLVLCMQEGKLSQPFQQHPKDVDISDAMQVFGHLPTDVTPPAWLQEMADALDDEDERKDGRTYLATRTLPGGEGAFAYLAVTLADEEPKWLGGGEGLFDRAMEEKFMEYVPPVSEMEQILLRRKDPAEREKVLAFYDALMQNINQELEEQVLPADNLTVTGLIEQLTDDLRRKGQYGPFEEMDEQKRRNELLLMLHERVYARRQKIARREEVLDDIEQRTLPQSFFEVSAEDQDRIELPAAMWEQAINKFPNKKHMDSLFENYPNILIQKFLDLLANEKEEIAMRLQKRHQNIVAQMRKELRREGLKGKARLVKAERACEQAIPILEAVKAAYKRQRDDELKLEEKKRAGMTEQAILYEQLRAALYDTQRSVEEEAERGRLLAEQINAVNAQSEVYQKVNDESIRKTEAENIALMKNIKRLRNAVKQHEGRVLQLQALSEGAQTQRKGAQQFFVL